MILVNTWFLYCGCSNIFVEFVPAMAAFVATNAAIDVSVAAFVVTIAAFVVTIAANDISVAAFVASIAAFDISVAAFVASIAAIGFTLAAFVVTIAAVDNSMAGFLLLLEVFIRLITNLVGRKFGWLSFTEVSWPAMRTLLCEESGFAQAHRSFTLFLGTGKVTSSKLGKTAVPMVLYLHQSKDSQFWWKSKFFFMLFGVFVSAAADGGKIKLKQYC